MVALLALPGPVSATPINLRRDATPETDPLSGIVSNFQDLSAVLSLLAADTVEDKLSDPESNDWERMTTTWCLFGILGVVRAYSKIAAGLSGAEAAGINLSGSGVYTSNRTRGAVSSWVVGSHSSQRLWQDDKRRLLGEVDGVGSPWIRPHVVVMGYSRCPLETRIRREVLGRSGWILFTAAVTACPILVLRIDHGNFLSNLALGVLVGSAVMSCAVALALQNLNAVGTTHLRDNTMDRFKHGSVLQDGDTVITSKQSSSNTILWQNTYAPRRSADSLFIRIFAGLSAMATLVGYIVNYLVLGAAQSPRAYVWLGVQVFILILRYCLWATRPGFLSQRDRCVLFFITGSLVPAINPMDPDVTHDLKITRDVVHFAVASAGSKVLNGGGTVSRLNLTALDLLADSAPRDILRARYCNFDELYSSKETRTFRVIRLPWSVMEEMYAAQGVILGKNPWALGGLYLGAVFEVHPQSFTFEGLTTIHPRTTKGGNTTVSLESKEPANIVGATFDNFGMTGTLSDGIIVGKLMANEGFEEWHTKFRENVATCRASAVSNGPSHCEVHVRYHGQGETGKKRMARMDASIKDVLAFGREVVSKEQDKDHSRCNNFCAIFGFDE